MRTAKIISLEEQKRIRREAKFKLELTGFPLLDACLSWNWQFSDAVLESLKSASFEKTVTVVTFKKEKLT